MTALNPRPLRIVAMNSFLPGYRLIAGWAERHGHEIVLVVTPPVGANQRYDENAGPFVLDLPKESSVLVTGKLRSIATPVIAALAPDLIISAAFPRLIPAEILGLPRLGALNLHPSALPAGRGPNPARLIYEGATTVGATLHRTEEDFDTGAILSRRERPLPDDLSGPAILAAWSELLREVLEEGAARAIAGDPGLAQDRSQASEAPRFTEAEQLLDLTEPAAILRRKTAALNVTGPSARVRLGDSETVVHHLYAVSPGDRSGAGSAQRTEPGTVLEKYADGWMVQAGDSAVRLVTSPLNRNS
jgi:methionyl-tRNA formyltransferase